MDDLFDGRAGPPAPREARRARGARLNPAGRFEREARLADPEAWEADRIAGEGGPPRAVTEVLIDRARSVIARNESPDLGFDRSINPYRGCEHGCSYCFARPSHAFMGLSPGLDFETRIFVKPDAPARLEEELRRPGYVPAPIAIGTNTDPYQPLERDRRVMRGILEVLSAHRHPVAVVTKGALITRDLDVLGEMGRAGLARVGISLTTLNRRLSRAMEPRAAAPETRLRAIRKLAEAGVPVRAMIAPVVPALTDHELERLLAAAAAAGACAAEYVVLRLPREVAPLFEDWLAEHRPDAAARVMGRVRELHGGRDYDSRFGLRQTGQGVWGQLLARRFAAAAAREGLARRLPPLRTDLFRPPPRAGDQLVLF